MRFSAIFLLQKRLTITETVGKLSFNGYFSLAFPGSRSTIGKALLFTVSEGEKRKLVFSRNLSENEAFNKETIAFGNEGGFDTKKRQ